MDSTVIVYHVLEEVNTYRTRRRVRSSKVFAAGCDFLSLVLRLTPNTSPNVTPSSESAESTVAGCFPRFLARDFETCLLTRTAALCTEHQNQMYEYNYTGIPFINKRFSKNNRNMRKRSSIIITKTHSSSEEDRESLRPGFSLSSSSADASL